MVTPTEPTGQRTAAVREESEVGVGSERQVPQEDPEGLPPATESTDSRKEIPAAAVQSTVATGIQEPSNLPAPTPTPPSTPPPSLPEPPRCWGVRAYDGGYYDVGSFYIFHPEATTSNDEEMRDGMLKGKSQAGDTEEDSTKPRDPPRPFGYQFLEGLKVLDGRDGKEATGGSSEAAVQAFVELERQTVAVKRGLGCPSAEKPDGVQMDGGYTTGKATSRAESAEHGSRHRATSCLVVGNTADNETVRGLIRRGRAMWLGTFSLPPAPPGEEEEVLDLWPKKVLRFSEESGPEEAVALEGAPDGANPLVPPAEVKDVRDEPGSETKAVQDGAQTAYRLMAQALEELRSFVDCPPKDDEAEQNEEQEQKPKLGKRLENRQHSEGSSKGSSVLEASKEMAKPDTRRSEMMDVATPNGNGTMHEHRSREDATGKEKGRDNRASDRKPPGELGCDRDTHDSRGSSTGMGSGRGSPSRKRPRTEQGYPPHVSSPGKSRLDEMIVDRHEDEGEQLRGKGDREPINQNCRDDADVDDGVGAGEMTVVAVRTSLLRNRADEDPNPDDGDWEGMVRSFIGYVESLQPGPVQEELSLMFAAALDPTLVRMRAANALLVRLAEECAMPEADLEEDDEEYEDGDYRAGSSRGNGPATPSGFKVRLELDATPDGDEPPPEGVEYLLKTVGAARAALVGAARARACMAAAGDTLGGLHELKADYKRSLPSGPREPIQSIIAEEQARVRGYATAHEEIANRRVQELRLRGRDVGNAYRAVEGEPGWSGVRRQVDAFLRRFAAYCGAQLPGEGSEPGLLGLDIALPKMADGWQ